MAPRLEFALLGPLEVRLDGEPVAIGGLRRRSVLAMLVLDAGKVVSIPRLIGGVWGEEPPETAATALHGHVSHLRRLLGDVIETRAPGYVLAVDPETVDANRFEALLERARAEQADGRRDDARATLDEALGLWRGPPLADLVDAPFASAALPALEELGVAAREERIEAEIGAGRHAEVVPELKALVVEHPLRERAWRQLLVALHRSGRRAEALDAYDTARRTFSVAVLRVRHGRGSDELLSTEGAEPAGPAGR
ncbi:MAG TPA: AfsR/SARP family transcriptional regulator [Solirubrobacteraceae bacterium]